MIFEGKIEKIGANAFIGCKNLELTIPASVKEINFAAFGSVRRVTVAPENPRFKNGPAGEVIDIKEQRLIYLPPDTAGKYEMPGNIRRIGVNAISYNKKIEHLVISPGVEIIDSIAVAGCNELKKVVLPEGVEVIENMAFYTCWKLEKINFPASLRKIDQGAFYCCNLKEVNIPYGVKTIGSKAFYSCNNLTTVFIPDSVESIGDMAFACCMNLENISVPGHLAERVMEWGISGDCQINIRH